MGPIVTIIIALHKGKVNNRIFENFTTSSGIFQKRVETRKKAGDLMEGGKPPRDYKQSLRPYK